MNAFTYLLTLASVILGLAISDIAYSLHRLLGAGKRVKWDLLAPLAAALAFEKIVSQWWVWFSADNIAQNLTFAMYLGVLVSAVLLFLMAAATLPDDVTEPLIDLAASFETSRRRYWLIFATQWALGNVINIWLTLRLQRGNVDLVSPLFVIPVVAVGLSFVANRVVQAVGLAGFLILYTAAYFWRVLA